MGFKFRSDFENRMVIELFVFVVCWHLYIVAYKQALYKYYYYSDNVVGTTDCTIAVLNQLGYDTIADQVDIDDLAVLKHVAALIGFRAAKLVAINTAQLLKRISKDNNNQSKTSESVTIAIDGSVYKHHPRLKAWLEVLITKWAPGHKVCMHTKKPYVIAIIIF